MAAMTGPELMARFNEAADGAEGTRAQGSVCRTGSSTSDLGYCSDV